MPPNNPNIKAAHVVISSAALKRLKKVVYPETATKPERSPLARWTKLNSWPLKYLRKKAVIAAAAPASKVLAAIKPWRSGLFSPSKDLPALKKSQQAYNLILVRFEFYNKGTKSNVGGVEWGKSSWGLVRTKAVESGFEEYCYNESTNSCKKIDIS
jgi:hypothetical protein